MSNKLLTGDECFEFNGMPQAAHVSDFWSWAMSRLLMDGPRGDLAEYIVRMALNENPTEPKTGWGECDIVCKDGTRIEVKCSSFLQEWERETLSRPVFSIRKTQSNPVKIVDGKFYRLEHTDLSFERRSDVYVFCLFKEKCKERADPIKLDQWAFFVMSTKEINERFKDAKSLSLARLRKINAIECDFYGIERAVEDAKKYR